MRKFALSNKYLETFKEKPVPWGPVVYVTFKRTYARRLDDDNPSAGTEEWWQTCKRVIEGMFNMQKKHCYENNLPWDDAKAQRTAKIAYERLFDLKWTPPGRGLWMMGTPFVEERTQAGLFNCGFASTKDIATQFSHAFKWMMDALMVGIGVGFDTLGAGTLVIQKPGSSSSVPAIPENRYNNYQLINGTWYCQIADSREGWVESVGVLIDAYFQGTGKPAFDFSLIRDRGSIIKGFGGIASGPDPLSELLDNLSSLFEAAIGTPITSTIIVDIENFIGRCVVAGNVRRSAALALGKADDEAFLFLKDPSEVHELESKLATASPEEAALLQSLINATPLRSRRWGSNNSIDASPVKNFRKYTELTVKNGEPGFIFLENARTRGRFKDPIRYDDLKVMGFNPCVEQQLEDKELCCLVETYPWLHDSYEDYQITLKIAYLYSKTVTLSKTQWPETNAIMLKNRRIGLSMSGFVQAANKLSYSTMYEWCDRAYQYIQNLDGIYSDWLCIPRSKRSTSIKPSGSVSKLNGSTPGMHHPESEYYLQRIRFAEDSDMLPALEAAGYPIETCLWYPRTKVVTFPVHEKHFVRGKKEVSMWEQMEIAAKLQYYWADNSVSVTITFQDHEADSIPYALEQYRDRIKAVSFLKYKETGYAQAPYEACSKEEFDLLSARITPIQRFTSSDQGTGERFCTNDTCTI
jgi:adenosylcobalamin-dependent ribonucleoside-triphosphate reductase